jgi:hypothetical protein
VDPGLDPALGGGRRNQVGARATLGSGRCPTAGVCAADVRAAGVRADLDRDDRRPDVGGLALGHEQPGDDALVWGRQLDDRLGRLDLHDDLVDCHLVTGLDMPLDDVRLGQALADVRKQELLQL